MLRINRDAQVVRRGDSQAPNVQASTIMQTQQPMQICKHSNSDRSGIFQLSEDAFEGRQGRVLAQSD